LTSQPDLPIRLTNALDLTYTHASYTWQNHLTEAYISPSSLLFVDNDHFVAGAKDSLAVFNIHSQNAPIYESATRKGRKARKLYGADAAGIGGIVSSLALSCDNILAAGTYNRQVGLFENAGQGQSMAAFDLSYNDVDDGLLKGNGVSQLAWSPCGNYLFVAERQSDALLVYDIRQTGQRLSYLAGRKAHTTLKLSFDLAIDEYGKIDIWAGGTDGKIRAWRDITSREGRIEPDLAQQVSQGKRLLKLNHVLLILTTDTATVSNIILSRREPVLISTSGQRRSPSHLVGLDDSSSDSDTSSSEDDSDSEQSESDGEEIERLEARDEPPASDTASNLAVEHPWQGPAFDNVLSFWHIL
jgi:WD40 repeat protein